MGMRSTHAVPDKDARQDESKPVTYTETGTSRAQDVAVVSGGSTPKSATTQVFTSEDIDDTASHTSTEFDSSDYSQLLVYLTMSKTLSPTDMRIFMEFENDAGSWFSVDYGFLADLRVAGSFLTVALSKCYPVDVVGTNARLRIVGNGTSGTNYFTVSAWIQGVA